MRRRFVTLIYNPEIPEVKRMKCFRRACCLLLCVLFLLPLSALGEEDVLTQAGLALFGSEVYYPQLTKAPDDTLLEDINRLIVTGLHADQYLDRMALVMSNTVKITTTYTADVTGDVLTCVLSASGPLKNNRATHAFTSVNIDLLTGQEITLADVFASPEDAVICLETLLTETIAPELSAHLDASAVTPLPEMFALTPWGMTLYYPVEQLSALSGQAGAIHLTWGEVQSVGAELILSPGSILDRMGVFKHLTLSENTPALLEEALSGRCLPGIPAVLDEAVAPLVESHHLLIDPDLYEGGRMLSLQGAAFRQVYVLTDSLTEAFDHSVVQGIRADRLTLCGLVTGQTLREVYLAVLGQPRSTVTLAGDDAEKWRLPEGVSDYYSVGGMTLRLHCNQEGVLTIVFLTP